MDLFEEFRQLTSTFDNKKIEYALCGGLAMAVYAFPRATVDIDILIQPETLEKAKTVAKKLGYAFDAGLMQFKAGAIQIYRLTKAGEDSDDSLVLHMLLVTPAIRDTWESRKRLQWKEEELPVVSPRGLIHREVVQKDVH